jgi:hypothetical protein
MLTTFTSGEIIDEQRELVVLIGGAAAYLPRVHANHCSALPIGYPRRALMIEAESAAAGLEVDLDVEPLVLGVEFGVGRAKCTSLTAAQDAGA